MLCMRAPNRLAEVRKTTGYEHRPLRFWIWLERSHAAVNDEFATQHKS
jgi:hypothetical protein